MIISKKNKDNSSLFQRELEKYPDHVLVMIAKHHKYLPSLEAKNKTIIFLKDEHFSEEVAERLGEHTVFFKDTLKSSKKPVISTHTFSDRIYKNLFQNAEQAINDAGKYSAFAYNELDIENKTEFIVISATDHCPDSMLLLSPSAPETHEKSQIKSVICYPHTI
jgi:hypothetical protein